MQTNVWSLTIADLRIKLDFVVVNISTASISCEISLLASGCLQSLQLYEDQVTLGKLETHACKYVFGILTRPGLILISIRS